MQYCMGTFVITITKNKGCYKMTDFDLKHKAVKQVIIHMKKKVPEEYSGSKYLNKWFEEMDSILEETEFVLPKYYEMRRELNDIIERIFDDTIRRRLRDSWYSFGKALDKKVTPK